MNKILTAIEAALYLKVHVRTIYRLAKKGLIPASKVGGHWRLKRATLDEWLSEDSVQRRKCEKPVGHNFI
jgi:excisionase family DNA binding protein